MTSFPLYSSTRSENRSCMDSIRIKSLYSFMILQTDKADQQKRGWPTPEVCQSTQYGSIANGVGLDKLVASSN
jgi:hypothetical protein